MLNRPTGITVDSVDNVYVNGSSTFKITPGGVITEIMDLVGHIAAIDGTGNVYVIGGDNDNAFKITQSGVITEIIDETGDGLGNNPRFFQLYCV